MDENTQGLLNRIEIGKNINLKNDGYISYPYDITPTPSQEGSLQLSQYTIFSEKK